MRRMILRQLRMSVIDDLISETRNDKDRKDSDGSPQMRLCHWLMSPPLHDLRGQDVVDARATCGM